MLINMYISCIINLYMYKFELQQYVQYLQNLSNIAKQICA